MSRRPPAFLACLLALLLLLPTFLHPGLAAADVADVLLEVPWRTLVDGSPFQKTNSGPAVLGMALEAFGVPVATGQLREALPQWGGLLEEEVGIIPLIRLAEVYDLAPHGNGPSFMGWTPEGVREHLRHGHPVITRLLHVTGTDGKQKTNQYVLIVGYAGTRFIYHDPALPSALIGQRRLVSEADLAKSWTTSLSPVLAFAVGQPRRVPAMPPATPLVIPALRADLPELVRWWPRIVAHAAWHQIDPYFVAAVMQAESSGNPQALGDHGHSVGLMQLHDEGLGWGWLDLRYDPEINLWVGTAALARGYYAYGSLRASYAGYFNPGGETQADRVMAWYERLVAGSR